MRECISESDKIKTIVKIFGRKSIPHMETPTSDEKVFAALAHASVIFAFFGPVGPALIWAYQRDKSKYVRFHALQAMGYQALTFWLFIAGLFVVMFAGIFIMSAIGALLVGSGSMDPEFFPLLIQPVIFVGMFGLMGFFFVIGMAGAVFCMLGRDFNYPFIGRWLKTKVFAEQLTEQQTEEWEDDWVSGVCHATIILHLWGIITPLIIWFSQKERSLKLRFQAMQAALYQLIAIIVYLVGMVAYMGIFLLMFGSLAVMGVMGPSSADAEPPAIFAIIFLIFFALIMIFWAIAAIITPIYYILAIVASIRTIRGSDFKYPILGGMLAKRMNTPTPESLPAA
jgi:uncharacterized Tic20 family protein